MSQPSLAVPAAGAMQRTSTKGSSDGASTDDHNNTSSNNLAQPASAPATLSQQADALSRLPPDISSPHELTDWVDAVLDRLENRFNAANQQYETRMQEMTDRIDKLDTSIQNLINSAVGPSTARQNSLSASVRSSESNHASPRIE